MAIYRTLQLSFWTDNKVQDDFTPEDKYFYLYLLTNPQTNLCGCYEISYSEMVIHTGYNKDTVMRLLDRFEKVHNLIRFSPETKEILILNWYKYNWSKSSATIKGILKDSENIKCEAFRNFIVNAIECVKSEAPYRPPIGPLQASVSVTVLNNTNNDSILDLNNKDLNTKDLQDTTLGEKTKDLNFTLDTNNTKKAKPEKHQYGEYKHVLLTDEERDRLFNDYGEAETLEAIKFLDECIEMKGYSYKSHNLALRRWVFRAVSEEKNRTNRSGGNKRDNQLDIALAYIKEHENEQNGSNETVGSHKSFFS